MRSDLPGGERRSNSALRNGKNFTPGFSKNGFKLSVTNYNYLYLDNSFTRQHFSSAFSNSLSKTNIVLRRGLVDMTNVMLLPSGSSENHKM